MTNWQPLFAIAQNTLRETIRDRVLYVFIVFAFFFTLAGSLIGSLSVGQDLRVLEDLGLATISLIGGIIAIFVGTTLVYKELDKRTIYLIVTKPISRWQFVSGKYLGLSLCVLLVTAAMGLFLIAVVVCMSPTHHVSVFLYECLGLIYLELLFVTVLATFFSTIATPIMSVVFTLSVWLIAHMGQSLKDLGRLSDNPVMNQVCNAIYCLLPDLARLTQIRADLMYGRQPEIELLLYLLTYITAYIVFLLTLSTLVTEGREFS